LWGYLVISVAISQPHTHHQLDSSPLFQSANQICHVTLTAYCLPHVRLKKNAQPIHIHLKMAIAMFAEMLDKFEHLTQLIP
jgi:hypothetical protein